MYEFSFKRSAKKFTDGTVSFIHSEPKLDKNTGAPSFPGDVASGVGILLSERAQSQYMRHGSPCERITWVRLKGPVTNLFVIAVYVPHRARVEPCQQDTLRSLIELLKQVPKNDCVVLLGDFNEQLSGNTEMLTGKWAFGNKSANADEILNIMRLFNLFAVSTKFQPKKNSSSATYAFCEQGSFMPKAHQFTGSKVRAFYKGKMVGGVVGDMVQGQDGDNKCKMWNVSFEDGYSTICREKVIRSWLIPAKRSFKQIDHILVSHRWLSCITDCRSDWAPSIQRSKWGLKEDHAMVRSTWKWRLRKVEPTTGVDFSALALPTANYAMRFDNEFTKQYSNAEDTLVDPACPVQDSDALVDQSESKIDEGEVASNATVIDTKHQYVRWQKALRAAAKASLHTQETKR